MKLKKLFILLHILLIHNYSILKSFPFSNMMSTPNTTALKIQQLQMAEFEEVSESFHGNMSWTTAKIHQPQYWGLFFLFLSDDYFHLSLRFRCNAMSPSLRSICIVTSCLSLFSFWRWRRNNVIPFFIGYNYTVIAGGWLWRPMFQPPSTCLIHHNP